MPRTCYLVLPPTRGQHSTVLCDINNSNSRGQFIVLFDGSSKPGIAVMQLVGAACTASWPPIIVERSVCSVMGLNCLKTRCFKTHRTTIQLSDTKA